MARGQCGHLLCPAPSSSLSDGTSGLPTNLQCPSATGKASSPRGALALSPGRSALFLSLASSTRRSSQGSQPLISRLRVQDNRAVSLLEQETLNQAPLAQDGQQTLGYPLLVSWWPVSARKRGLGGALPLTPHLASRLNSEP